MSKNNKKIYVIRSDGPKPHIHTMPSQSDAEETRRRLGLDHENKAKGAPHRRKRRRSITRWNPWISIAATYLLGPLAVVPRKGEGWVWKIFALVFFAAVASLVWFRQPVLDALVTGNPVVVLTGASLAGILVLGFVTWSRAMLLSGRDLFAAQRKIPEWLTRPAVIGLLGFLIPGTGLLLAGHIKRAAMALWAILLILVSVAIVIHGPELWGGRPGGTAGGSSLGLELFLLTGLAAGLVGGIVWIVQALDGLRAAIQWRARHQPSRSDWVAALLIVAVMALIVTGNPTGTAHELDRYARSAEVAGFRFVPLGLAEAATRLDPSQPAYSLHLASVYERFGRSRTAADIRHELELKWTTYQELADQTAQPSPSHEFDLVGSPANGIAFHRYERGSPKAPSAATR